MTYYSRCQTVRMRSLSLYLSTCSGEGVDFDDVPSGNIIRYDSKLFVCQPQKPGITQQLPLVIFAETQSVKEQSQSGRADLNRKDKDTIKGGSRRAEKSSKVLMMMKAAKLGWAGAGAGKKTAQGQ